MKISTPFFVIVLGCLFLSGESVRAEQSAEDHRCPTVPRVAGVTAYYRQDGKLVELIAPKDRVRFTYYGVKYDILHTEFKLRLPKPNKFGQHDAWGPVRWSLYDAKSGDLAEVDTYELKTKGNLGMTINPKTGHIDGWAKRWEIPAGADLTKPYVGPADYVTVGGAHTPDGNQALTITEPLNIHKAECYSFAGASYPMHLPTAAQAPAPQAAPTAKGKRIYLENGTGWYEVHDDTGELIDDLQRDAQDQNDAVDAR